MVEHQPSRRDFDRTAQPATPDGHADDLGVSELVAAMQAALNELRALVEGAEATRSAAAACWTASLSKPGRAERFSGPG